MAETVLNESLENGQVIRLTLNSPKANILDSKMMAELQSELDILKERPDVKLLQFIGAGEHFSFGASVQEHTRKNAPNMLKQFHSLFHTLDDLAIPTAALVSGQCLGGGLELALMCNFIFVDATAKLGQPEITLGVFPPPASLILPLKIGQARADDLLLTGRSITADEAVTMGLAVAKYDNKEIMLAEVDQWTKKRILPKSASSLRFAVKASRLEFSKSLSEGLTSLERLYLEELMATHDANEGIASFLERRKPDWQNR